MRIESVRIQNFRAFEDQIVTLDDYTCLVGPNGSGKSTVLAALNVLFRHQVGAASVTALSDQDFHNRNTDDPVRITVTFKDLSDGAKDDLSAYVRQDRLVVTARAEWDQDSKSAPVKQFGSRLVMDAFATYFEHEKDGASANDLKDIYSRLKENQPELPGVRTKADMATALREYEESHPTLCTLRESPDEFYGFTKGANRIAPHCQWVFVPAVKDASEEEIEGKNTALGELLQRTVRTRVSFDEELLLIRKDLADQYQALLREQEGVLSSLSESIQTKLEEWAHPGARVRLHWQFDPSKSVQIGEPLAKADVGEGAFLGDLARLGHGLQRSFIVSLLHELAEGPEGEGPTLLLGVEEPELYQHPPQARHLATVFERLSQEDSQIIVTTHSPHFISGRGFESVRMVRNGGGSGPSAVSQVTHEQVGAKLADALGEEPPSGSSVMAVVEQIMQPSQNELFFSRVPILVEGVEDVAFISTHLHLTDSWPDFRKLGCHFVISEGKGKMSRALAIARLLQVPAFAVFDGDGHMGVEETTHRRDNGCLLCLCECEEADTFPSNHFFGDAVVMWHETIGRGVRQGFGLDTWEEAERTARERYRLHDGVRRKNTTLISATLETLSERGTTSALLDRLWDHIRAFAERYR